MTSSDLGKYGKITGGEREKLGAELAQVYQSGTSVRAIAEDRGRSYGWVHKLLEEAGVTFRPRGGVQKEA